MSADSKNVSDNINSFHANFQNSLPTQVDVIGAHADPARNYPGVGKTCLINRIIRGTYIEPAPIIAASGVTKTIVPGTIHLRDNSLADIEEKILPLTHHMDIVLCCYDVTDKESFYFVEKNFDKIRKEADLTGAKRLVIVATKCDEPKEKHQVSTEKGRGLAGKKKVEYVETSAKTGIGCEDLINILIPSRVEYLKYGAEVEAEATKNDRRCIIS